MRHKLMRANLMRPKPARMYLWQTTALLLLVCASAGGAPAQQPPAPQPPAPAQQQPTGPALVNGALAVAGAPATDTVPAKFSPKSAADDQLITVGYTFKTLTAEQRATIYQALKDKPAASSLAADIGTVLPFATDLHEVPDDVVARVPQTKGYQYVVANKQVLLVSPQTRFVVGVFSDRT